MEYIKTILKNNIEVSDIISLHYFEYTVDFAFSGELHDFWEIVYADKSDFFVTADTEEFVLKQGNMYIHKPMEFHNIRANGITAPNSVIISFSCAAPELYEIAGRVISLSNDEKKLMAGMIEEGKKAFSTPLGDPYTKELIRADIPSFGSEQLIRIYLENLLISSIRNFRSSEHSNVPIDEKLSARRKDEVRLKAICDFLAKNVENDISSADILNEFFISESSLQKLFQSKVGCGAMQYFQKLKIDRAKTLIREKKLNFSEISEKLSYSSIHYFSRRFKSIAGMTPSEYASSVKSIEKN